MTTSLRNVLTATSAVALIALLAGCGTDYPPSTPTESGTVEPDPQDPASALVSEYLDAIALGNQGGAWELLSPETQATYDSSAETYAEYSLDNETVTATDAEVFAEAPLVVTDGPENGFQLVSAQTTDIADAWIVRDTDVGLRIDDPGVPPTGQRPFTWQNPKDGVYDSTVAPMIFFQTFYGEGGETDVISGPPETIVGYADSVEVPVTKEAASGAGANFVADVPAGAFALTVVWAPDDESPLFQSSTVTLATSLP
ncbi:hypothetical protein GCM10027413_32510 [Conyzicola nivalis]|uniref:Lipoprotein n=1 Tax=Conyzicola nivalis TaxID=1477021 RepID=A0A916WM53_9MICO|nr:hypothetical protein [Conyzicola nivalis]GGB11279.1 hypothetical protein GCM10010979_26980 [Conyzicola nivalis]